MRSLLLFPGDGSAFFSQEPGRPRAADSAVGPGSFDNVFPRS
jgi:hypothetical protein